MTFQQLSWKCTDGTDMYACAWHPEQRTSAKAVVGFVHGMGEHMGRYVHVAEMLNADGYAVIGFDQRGHGRTSGKRGHTPSYESLFEGIDRMLAEAEASYPGLPVFLLAHSMGGNVALNYMLRKQPRIAGAIVSGPWLKLAFKPPSLQVVLGRVIERFYPKYTSNRPLKAANLTSDPDMIARYVSDPLGHGQITAKFFFSMLRSGRWAIEHAGQLNVPTLIMHATADKVTSAAASKLFAERAGPSCEWIGWDGFQHELFNELRREEVFAVVRDWLARRLDVN
ncbi:alpha/beta hydrolase [Cohnella yongneupensis]|uniref:Alpha/beta hydrolase n=1 Tax=Cohnella yongneupensis TaxID=425006 RepID=A0ABW0QZA4_9BACL